MIMDAISETFDKLLPMDEEIELGYNGTNI